MTARHRAAARGDFRTATAAIALAFAVSTALPATPLFAQSGTPQAASPTRPIELGRPVSGSFASTAPEAEPPHHDYRLTLTGEQTIRITMDSPDPSADTTQADSGFDTYLELRAEGEEEPLRTDDDSGEGLNSRLVFTAPSGGTYIIRARPLGSVDPSQNSTYRLLVEAMAPPPPPGQFSGSQVEGDLGEGSPEDESYEPVRYAAYWFEGQARERILFDMTANTQGPSIQILDANGAVLNSNTAYDSNRVQAITVLPSAGRYLVRAQVPASQAAHYTLGLTRATTPRPAETGRIAVGGTASGRFALDSTAEPRPDGSGQIDFFYQLYTLELRQGEPVTAIATATGFEPMLEAGTPSVLGFVPVLSGMPTAEGGNTRLVINPFQSGTAVLRVRTPTLETGSYELRVVSGTQAD